jgi:hypothetical protein
MKRTAVLITTLALAAPGAAFAQDAPNALDDTYTSDQRVLGEVGTVDSGGSGPSQGTQPAAEEAAAPVSAPVAADSGSLPFTGFDAALIAGGGLLLLLGGFVLRRVARPQL